MFSKHIRPTLLLLAIALSVAGCADVTGPHPAPATAPNPWLIGGLVGAVDQTLDILGEPVDSSVYVVRRKVPLAEPITVSKVIGYEGGTIVVPNTGLTMTIPRGALYRATTITITAPAGDKVAYEFGPHGLQFYKAVRVTQSIEGTYAPNANPKYEAVYFGPSDDGLLGTLVDVVLEILPVNLDSLAASFDIRHFSGYLLSSGRTESYGGE